MRLIGGRKTSWGCLPSNLVVIAPWARSSRAMREEVSAEAAMGFAETVAARRAAAITSFIVALSSLGLFRLVRCEMVSECVVQ